VGILIWVEAFSLYSMDLQFSLLQVPWLVQHKYLIIQTVKFQFRSVPGGRISSAFVHVEAQWISVTPSGSLHGMFSPLHHPPFVSPISADTLSGELHSHPDPYKVDFVLSGLHFGFVVGFVSSSVSWGLFLKTPATFRAYFRYHNSLYIFATPRF